MRKLLLVIGAIALASVSAAVGWFGVGYFMNSDPEDVATPDPSPTPEPGEQTVSLTFDLAQIEAAVAGLFDPPTCGETWTSEGVPAHGVSPAVDVTTISDADAVASVSFTTDADFATAFLAQHGQVIITRDDVVVTPDWGSEFVPELVVVDPAEGPTPGPDSVAFSGAALCDVAQEMAAIWEGFDWDGATDEEINERYAMAAEFEEDNATLPPGEYKIYAWTPVILGEDAAIAIALAEEGITDLAYLQYTAGYSPLADDSRITPYCRQSETPDGEIESLCDVPQDVLAEVLRRDVPVSSVVDAEPEVAISAPFVLTVD